MLSLHDRHFLHWCGLWLQLCTLCPPLVLHCFRFIFLQEYVTLKCDLKVMIFSLLFFLSPPPLSLSHSLNIHTHTHTLSKAIKEGCEEKNDQTCTLRCCWQGLPDGNTPTVTFQRPYSTPSRNVSLLAVEKAFSTPTCIFNRPEEPDYFECYAEAPHLCQSPDYTCIVTQMGQTAKQYLKITSKYTLPEMILSFVVANRAL